MSRYCSSTASRLKLTTWPRARVLFRSRARPRLEMAYSVTARSPGGGISIADTWAHVNASKVSLIDIATP